MIYLLGIALLIFWAGAVLLILSITHIILAPVPYVLAGWLFLVIVSIVAIWWYDRKLEQLKKKNNEMIDRANAAAKRKVAEMQNKYQNQHQKHHYPRSLAGAFFIYKMPKISLQSLQNGLKYYVSDLAGWFNISARTANNNKEITKNG